MGRVVVCMLKFAAARGGADIAEELEVRGGKVGRRGCCF